VGFSSGRSFKKLFKAECYYELESATTEPSSKSLSFVNLCEQKMILEQ